MKLFSQHPGINKNIMKKIHSEKRIIINFKIDEKMSFFFFLDAFKVIFLIQF